MRLSTGSAWNSDHRSESTPAVASVRCLPPQRPLPLLPQSVAPPPRPQASHIGGTLAPHAFGVHLPMSDSAPTWPVAVRPLCRLCVADRCHPTGVPQLDNFHCVFLISSFLSQTASHSSATCSDVVVASASHPVLTRLSSSATRVSTLPACDSSSSTLPVFSANCCSNARTRSVSSNVALCRLQLHLAMHQLTRSRMILPQLTVLCRQPLDLPLKAVDPDRRVSIATCHRWYSLLTPQLNSWQM